MTLGFEFLVYSAMLFAAIAMAWSYRKRLKNGLFPRKVATTVENEYDEIVLNDAVQLILNWKSVNDGKKQNESVFRENGKIISKSHTYKTIRKNVLC